MFVICSYIRIQSEVLREQSGFKSPNSVSSYLLSVPWRFVLRDCGISRISSLVFLSDYMEPNTNTNKFV